MCRDVVKSPMESQELGVTQGSRIGRLVFEIFSSDFASTCSNNESIFYADNIVLVCIGLLMYELTDHLDNGLRNTLD